MIYKKQLKLALASILLTTQANAVTLEEMEAAYGEKEYTLSQVIDSIETVANYHGLFLRCNAQVTVYGRQGFEKPPCQRVLENGDNLKKDFTAMEKALTWLEANKKAVVKKAAKKNPASMWRMKMASMSLQQAWQEMKKFKQLRSQYNY